MAKRTLEELNVIDDFLFHEMVTRDKKGEEFCRILLKTILKKEFKNIKVSVQKTVQGRNTDKHGIRLDAYIETASEEEKTNEKEDVEILPDIYEIEPNTYKDNAEARRARYYHALIDTKILRSGVSYDKLQNVVMIMILPYDPFGKDRMVYTVKNNCMEEPALDYEDGNITIYLYTKGTNGNPGRELQDMLKYLEKSTEENVTNEDIAAVHRLATEVKMDEEVGISYMKYWEWEAIIESDAKKRGLEEGQLKILIKQICKKMKKQFLIEEIADQLEMDVKDIQQIYEVAKIYAPEYDEGKILEKLQDHHKK